MNTRARRSLLIVSLLALVLPPARADEKQPRILTPAGTAVDGAYFPIAVWLQSPRHAARFQEAGINLYVFAVNLSPEPGTVRFSLPEPFATRAVPLDGTAAVMLKEGQFASDFPGYGVNLYRLDPASP